ncbi:MAG: nickel pincer cofactor biosynthesis protein LarB [Chloroflexi bacterium]|nr:nickel pincer cofactor biosynthesis protein LarB [Chloroflexota bacterium]MCL5108097.1 nickel pincer cofactor biosynthesis protein LarB [Chloroflexota bacterium]
MNDPLKELIDSLVEESGPEALTAEGPARIDATRENRKGIPEVILAQGKRPEHVLQIAHSFLQLTGRAIISRVEAPLLEQIETEFAAVEIENHPASRMVVLRRPGQIRPTGGGKVGVITAGTSDVPVAEEAAIVAAEMGCAVTSAYDVGVSGIHRLFQPLREMLRSEVDAVVVAAGMDGALPSVVAGLVDVPVIGVPTSVGYGLGGQGLAALLSMLQSCSPGLAVVNIDNGIGAGATAALIANRAAKAREKGSAQ